MYRNTCSDLENVDLFFVEFRFDTAENELSEVEVFIMFFIILAMLMNC